MLKRLEVQNFYGFENKVILDFSGTKNYSYSKNLIKNKLVKNSVVFGKNGSGKSSLCKALMDITLHLLDKQKDKAITPHYTNCGTNDNKADFTYVFQFGKKELTYRYIKLAPLTLAYEEVSVNGKKILVHDYIDESQNFVNISGAANLITAGMQQELSCVKFVYNNTIHNDNSDLTQLINFVSGMLYFRSLLIYNKMATYKVIFKIYIPVASIVLFINLILSKVKSIIFSFSFSSSTIYIFNSLLSLKKFSSIT